MKHRETEEIHYLGTMSKACFSLCYITCILCHLCTHPSFCLNVWWNCSTTKHRQTEIGIKNQNKIFQEFTAPLCTQYTITENTEHNKSCRECLVICKFD